MIKYVPEWAQNSGGGAADHGATDHDAMDSQADGMDAHAGHDMGDSNMETNTNADHDLGENSSSPTHTMDPEFDMGPDMNEAVTIANGKRLLRGRRLEDVQDHVENIANLKPYDDGGCVGISEVSKDMLPPSWGGTNEMYVHPSRPIEKGIYTMDELK